VHADTAFTIPPESEIIVQGKLNAELPLKKAVCGLVVPRNDLPHRYSIFGASALVKITENGTLPAIMVNPSSRSVKIFFKTRLGDFESVDDKISTFQLSEAPEKFTYSFNTRRKVELHKPIILSSLLYPTAFSVKLTKLNLVTYSSPTVMFLLLLMTNLVKLLLSNTL